MSQQESCFNCGTHYLDIDILNPDLDRCRCAICGNYRIVGTAKAMANKIPPGKRWILSSWIRDQNERGNEPIIDSNYYENIFLHINEPNVGEKFTRLLIRIGTQSKFGGQFVSINPGIDYALYWAANEDELWWMTKQLATSGLLDNSANVMNEINLIVTADGWQQIEQLRGHSIDSNQVFVAMWFDLSMETIYEEGFKAAIESEEVEYKAMRIDRKEHVNKIDDEIVMEIRRSRALVADFTGNRGGVYFEAGFALGLGKPVIWTCREDKISEVHFDARQYNQIAWNSADELRDKLKKRILALGI